MSEDRTAIMKELIDYIARSLVDMPDQVEIREVTDDQATVLELRVAREDIGKIIGKQGRTARAIRAILAAASIRANKRVVLEIME